MRIATAALVESTERLTRWVSRAGQFCRVMRMQRDARKEKTELTKQRPAKIYKAFIDNLMYICTENTSAKHWRLLLESYQKNFPMLLWKTQLPHRLRVFSGYTHQEAMYNITSNAKWKTIDSHNKNVHLH